MSWNGINRIQSRVADLTPYQLTWYVFNLTLLHPLLNCDRLDFFFAINTTLEQLVCLCTLTSIPMVILLLAHRYTRHQTVDSKAKRMCQSLQSISFPYNINTHMWHVWFAIWNMSVRRCHTCTHYVLCVVPYTPPFMQCIYFVRVLFLVFVRQHTTHCDNQLGQKCWELWKHEIFNVISCCAATIQFFKWNYLIATSKNRTAKIG